MHDNVQRYSITVLEIIGNYYRVRCRANISGTSLLIKKKSMQEVTIIRAINVLANSRNRQEFMNEC